MDYEKKEYYLIFYRVDEENGKVYIIRVIYGARNYAKLL